MPLLQNESKCEMQVHFHADRNHFHKNGFTLRLALKQRHRGTRPGMAYSYGFGSRCKIWQKWYTARAYTQPYARPNVTKYHVYQFFYVDEKFTHQVIYFNTKWYIFLCQVENLYIKFITLLSVANFF